jgi:beta-lactamase class A
LLISIILFCCKPEQNKSLDLKITNLLEQVEGDFAIAFQDLNREKNNFFLNENEKFHAASTMKVPVMIEMYNQASQGKFSLNDSILVENKFKSIVDDTSYEMNAAEDSEPLLYDRIGKQVTFFDLMYQMIIMSSNLATNILVKEIGCKNITASMKRLGAYDTEVLRGVEDQKAYDLGLNNVTTAKDLMTIIKSIAVPSVEIAEDQMAMINVLKDQKFNDIIPRFLPIDVQVAHKTGSITGLHHDAGIIYLPNGESYVLILLSKNLKDFDEGTLTLAKISRLIYDHVIDL